MKAHTRHVAVGGIVGPIALVLATIIANEAQSLLGLGLEKQALAIYLIPFLLGAAAVLHGQLRLEGEKIGADLAPLLGGLGGLLGGAPIEAAPPGRGGSPTPSTTSESPAPPPPPLSASQPLPPPPEP